MLWCTALTAVGRELPVDSVDDNVATIGTFLYGQATPLVSPADPRFERLSFVFERCGSVLRTSWYDTDQGLLASDELEAPGDKLRRYLYWRANVGEGALMTRRGALLSIDRQSAGQHRIVDLPVADDIAAGPMIALLAERELPHLQLGQQLRLSYVVPEKFAIYGFSVARIAPTSGALREIEVTPVSWLIRRVVSPLQLYYDADGFLVRLHGRVLPVSGTAAREQPLDVDARVQRRETHGCSTQLSAEATRGY